MPVLKLLPAPVASVRPCGIAVALSLSAVMHSGGAQAQGTPAAGTSEPGALPAVTVREAAQPQPGARKSGGFSTRGASVGVLGERELLDVPFSITVVPRELLDSAGVSDLKGLTRVDPSLAPSFSAAGYYDAVSIRGLSLNNWSNYYKNGLLFPNQAKTAFENIDRIEVHRGLTGFLQGFSSPGGSVNYVTERPTATWQSRAELRADEYGTFVPGVDFGGPVSEDGRLGLRINLTGGQEASFVDQVKSDRAFGSLALDWQATDAVQVQLDAQLDRRDGPTQPALQFDSSGRLPMNVDPRRFLGQPWHTYDARTREVGLGVQWRVAPGWTVHAKANRAHLYRDDFSSNLDNLQPNGDFDVLEYKSPDETRDSTNGEVALRGVVRTGGIAHEVGIGLSRRHLEARFGDGVYEVAGTSNLYAPVRIADPRTPAPPSYLAIDNRERGIFVSDFITFSDHWQALVGLRRAEVDFRSAFEAVPYRRSVLTPSFALIFKPVPTVSVYGSYVEGLTQGDSAPTDAANANAQLRPAESEQVEFGVKTDWLGGNLSTTAALFQIEQPLAYVDPASNEFGYNGERRHRGLEFTAAGQLRPGTRVSAGAVLFDAKALDTGTPAFDGRVPSGVAERQLNVWLEQALPVSGVSAQFGLRHASRRAAANDDTRFVPAWTVFDAGLRYETAWDGRPVALGLLLQNVADKTYFESSGSGLLYFGAPRTLSASASIAF